MWLKILGKKLEPKNKKLEPKKEKKLEPKKEEEEIGNGKGINYN